jgi:hypothetical protein
MSTAALVLALAEVPESQHFAAVEAAFARKADESVAAQLLKSHPYSWSRSVEKAHGLHAH